MNYNDDNDDNDVESDDDSDYDEVIGKFQMYKNSNNNEGDDDYSGNGYDRQSVLRGAMHCNDDDDGGDGERGQAWGA